MWISVRVHETEYKEQVKIAYVLFRLHIALKYQLKFQVWRGINNYV